MIFLIVDFNRKRDEDLVEEFFLFWGIEKGIVL